MAKSKFIISLGVIIALLPLLGFPHSWESFFQVVAGLSIVGLSVWTKIDKKITLKVKAQKRQAKKASENIASQTTEEPLKEEPVELTF